MFSVVQMNLLKPLLPNSHCFSLKDRHIYTLVEGGEEREL